MSETSNKPGFSEDTTRQSNRKRPAGPLAALVVILLALAGRFGFGGFGNGAGLLPGGQAVSGRAAAESEAAAGTSAPETSAAAEETSVETAAETAAEVTVKVIEVTVNEDGYLFQNQKCSLEDLFVDLKEGDEIHYIVQKGSKDDVDDLVDAAKEKGIKTVKKD